MASECHVVCLLHTIELATFQVNNLQVLGIPARVSMAQRIASLLMQGFLTQTEARDALSMFSLKEILEMKGYDELVAEAVRQKMEEQKRTPAYSFV